MSRNPFNRRCLNLLASTGLGAGLMFQGAGCQLNQITATTVLDGQQAIIQVLRGLVLSPIDALIQDAVYSVFPSGDE